MTAAAWRAFYIAGYDWDPPGHVPDRRWQERLTAAGDDVVAAWRGTTIVGIALVGSRRRGPN